jgi:hypothetical protein
MRGFFVLGCSVFKRAIVLKAKSTPYEKYTYSILHSCYLTYCYFV